MGPVMAPSRNGGPDVKPADRKGRLARSSGMRARRTAFLRVWRGRRRPDVADFRSGQCAIDRMTGSGLETAKPPDISL